MKTNSLYAKKLSTLDCLTSVLEVMMMTTGTVVVLASR